MSPLRYPLKDHLQDPVDEATVHRMGLAIDERMQARGRRRVWPVLVLGTAAAAVLLVVALPRIHRDPGPLLLADGHEIVEMGAGRSGAEVEFSDGSRVWLSSGGRVQPVHSTGTSFSAIVSQGRADFDVRPGGPRRWTIECGLATVEVVGTAFSCERDAGHLRVSVRHGVVLVRGERVPERARRLAAGESLDIAEAPEARGATAEPTAESQGAAEGEGELAAAVAPEPSAQAKEPPAKSWRSLARRGHHSEAFAALGSEGLRRESKRLGVNDLLALADVARLSGHPAEAVLPLERILAEFAHDSQAPLAAFALGRLELDSLGRARAAAVAFRKALELGIPSGLREDVLARLVEACARSGDLRAAQQAAAGYHKEFPKGRHTQAIEGWLQLR
jgi:transmembrane sensor